MASTAPGLRSELCWPPLISPALLIRSGILLSFTSFFLLASLLALFAGPSLFSLTAELVLLCGAPRAVPSGYDVVYRRDLFSVRFSSPSSLTISLRWSLPTSVFPSTRTILLFGRLLLPLPLLLPVSKQPYNDSRLGLFTGSFLLTRLSAR